jgi:hypothetical protein
LQVALTDLHHCRVRRGDKQAKSYPDELAKPAKSGFRPIYTLLTDDVCAKRQQSFAAIDRWIFSTGLLAAFVIIC